MNGCIHGSAVAFFPYLVEFERFVAFMVILAFCAGAVSSTAGYRPVFLAYLVPALSPLGILWIVNFGGEIEWHHVYVGLLTLLYGGVLARLGYQAFSLFRASFEIRLQHVDLNRRLTAALDQSRDASAAKTRFLAVASHDLRQPVHALALFASSLSRRNLDDRTREIAQHIDSAIDTLSSQLDALLDLSRLDAGIVTPITASFDVGQMLTRVREQFEPLADAKMLTISVTCAPHTIVTTDETLLEQIVRNLLGNAIKYTDSGSIAIAVRSQEMERVSLTVKDTGRGIPADAQPHVFEEFYQVNDPGHDRSRGLGLGLAITKRLADLLGLRLTMQSAVGIGSAFTLELERAATSPAPKRAAPAPRDIGRKRALVVDDAAEVRDAMRLLLEDVGCSVQVAAGTAEALEHAADVRPDIVISDYRLRGDDNGLHTIQKLRARHPGLPAILVSGDSTVERLRDTLDPGIVLLHKPVRPDTLIAAIYELCGASSGAPRAEQGQKLRQQSDL